jgi:hypothetical protein
MKSFSNQNFFLLVAIASMVDITHINFSGGGGGGGSCTRRRRRRRRRRLF